MIKNTRIIIICILIILSLILRSQDYVIVIIVGLCSLSLISKYLFIQYNISKKKYLTIGLRRFYQNGLIYQIATGIVFCVYPLVLSKLKLPFEINNLIIIAAYLCMIEFFDWKKNIFILSKTFIFHKHKLKIIEWKLSSLDKVYVYQDTLEFVKDLHKLKVAFSNNDSKVNQINAFLEPILKTKLVKK